MPFSITGLTACPDCDLLQRSPSRTRHDIVCVRCGATLYRVVPHALEMTLALMLAAAALYCIALSFPAMTLVMHGREREATLLGMAVAFHEAGMSSVGVLVFVTLVVIPGLRILAMLWQLVPVRLGIVPPGLALLARLNQGVKISATASEMIIPMLLLIGIGLM